MVEERLYDLRLKHNASMIVAGPSQSGKSSYVKNLLLHRKIIFTEPLENVYWYYGVHQPEFHGQLQGEGIILEEGLPSSFDFVKPYSIIVLDDLMNEVKASKGNVTKLFTRIAHHKNCFVILITQNMFDKSSELRTQHLNAQYLVLFKNPRDALQVRILASQMYPGQSHFLTAVFQDATNKPHDYLLIDSHQETPDEVRLRSHMFQNEKPMIIYQRRV